MNFLFIKGILFTTLLVGYTGNSHGVQTAIDLSKLRGIFSKYTKVYGVHIFATDKVPNDKLLHASKVMAKYLDSDDDGTPNNQNVVNQLQKSAMLFVARDESERVFNAAYAAKSGVDTWQDLYEDETHLVNGKDGKFDASLEEILHLISSRGYEKQFDDLSCDKVGGSRLTKAMDMARGGNFKSIPNSYPPGAWYTYDDATCTYNCMCVEYFYWGLTTYLGAQSFSGRYDVIKNEWKVNGKNEFMSKDFGLYQILSSKGYDLPTVLPDGKYSSTQFEIMKLAAASGSSSVGSRSLLRVDILITVLFANFIIFHK